MSKVIVIPCLNEHDTLHEVLPLLKQHFPSWQILLVDDSSNFETKEFENNNIHVLPKMDKKRLGYARSLKIGLLTACHVLHADLIIQMDAEHDIESLNKLITYLQSSNEKFDLLVGREQMDKKHRRFKSEFASFLARKLLGFNIHQPTCGLRLWTRNAILKVQWNKLKAKAFEIQVEIVYNAGMNGLIVAETMINFHKRTKDKSKMKVRYIVYYLNNLARLTAKHLYHKLHYFILRS